MTLFEVFLLLMAGHALADYPLQGPFLAPGKNHRAPLPDVPWWQCLWAHAAIHGGVVGLVTQSPWLGLAEFFVHIAIDYGKCDGRYGFNVDQALHVFCKILWTLALFWIIR